MRRSEAPLSTGYSPFLNFSVEDLNTSIYKAMELGASMDGAIVYGHTGKVCAPACWLGCPAAA